MNNNHSIIPTIKERIIKSYYPVFHAPLVFDVNTQSSYRKAGYVAWPKTSKSDYQQKNQKNDRNLSGHGGYFAYPR